MKQSRHARTRRRLIGSGSVVLLAVAVGVLVVASPASSKSPSLTVDRSVEVGSSTEAIAVTPRGVAVYALSPETANHLLCTSRQCLSLWPPVKVAEGSRPTKGAGLKGRLSTLKRKGFTQLTLNGHPLYTFAEDKGRKGEAHGQGIKAFGGTWHVFRAGGSATSTTGTSPTVSSTTTSTTPNPYGY